MYGQVAGARLAGGLAEDARELGSLRTRVLDSVASLPRVDASGWSGPASWAYQLSLTLLHRETETASDLLRCASDLAVAASFEAGHGA
jgi:hypothetical protein